MSVFRQLFCANVYRVEYRTHEYSWSRLQYSHTSTCTLSYRTPSCSKSRFDCIHRCWRDKDLEVLHINTIDCTIVSEPWFIVMIAFFDQIISDVNKDLSAKDQNQDFSSRTRTGTRTSYDLILVLKEFLRTRTSTNITANRPSWFRLMKTVSNSPVNEIKYWICWILKHV